MFTSSGTPLKAWGNGLFYLPHGLTIDPQGAFWVTDVAMHQVHIYNIHLSVCTVGLYIILTHSSIFELL